ncbi:MAG: serine hydrolase, partial [Vicinamibacterales bacterium]
MVRAGMSALVCVGVLALGGHAWAGQAATGAGGHWVGSIQTPGPELAVEVDLVAKAADAYQGAISIPAQNAKGIPLNQITVKGTAVGFSIRGVPGEPRFTGTLSSDGKTITGDFM